jgi:tight adherence protein B
MSFDFDSIYLIYLLVAVSAGLFAEVVYLLFFSGASYRKNVNRRLKLLRNEPNRENILVQLRKERGLTSAGNYRVGLEALNRLVLQSGLTVGLGKLVAIIGCGCAVAFALGLFWRGDLIQALLIALFSGTALPYLVLRILRILRARRQRAFGAAVSRWSRHDRAQPARRPSGADCAHHGGARNARPDRQRVRHRRRRDHLRR